MSFEEVRWYRNGEPWILCVVRKEVILLELFDERTQMTLIDSSFALDVTLRATTGHQENGFRLRGAVSHDAFKFNAEFLVTFCNRRFRHESDKVANFLHSGQ